MAQFSYFRFRGIEHESQAAIRKAAALQLPDRIAVQSGQGFLFERELDIDDFLDLRQEPGIDAGQGVDFIKTETLCEGVAYVPDAFRAGFAQLDLQFLAIGGFLIQAVDADFQAAQGFLEGLLEGAAYGHRSEEHTSELQSLMR